MSWEAFSDAHIGGTQQNNKSNEKRREEINAARERNI